MRRSARAADPGAGLSVAQLELLSCVAQDPGVRPGQVGKLLRLAPSSVTTLVNGLVLAGYLARNSGAGDRRTASLSLPAAGEAAVNRWQAVNQDLVRGALRSLPPGSLIALRDAVPALRELAEAVDALADEPRDPLVM
jgi:DNA-binding MarR family transcriptional regulator